MDLELLREIFKDQRLHIAIGKITQLGLSDDRSCLRVQVSILPEEREIVAMMSWEAVGADAGFFMFPEINDLVIIGQAEGDHEQAFVLKRLTSREEKIPLQATNGHLVARSRAGTNAYLQSDTLAAIGKPDGPADQPMVLGNVLKTALGNLYDALTNLITKLDSDPVVICSAPGQPGYIHPTLKTDIDAIKASLSSDKSTFVTTASSNIVSQIAFTERGT